MDKRIALHISILFISILAAQVLICNHILLFGVAMPLITVYFIARTPIGINRNLLLTLAFLLGLAVDICSDTPGLNALACTLAAAMRRPVFFAYVQNDDRVKDIIPNIRTLGIADYCKYLLTLVAIYCLMIFSIEYFSFADIKEIAVLTSCSTILTFVLLLGLDSLVTVRRERH